MRARLGAEPNRSGNTALELIASGFYGVGVAGR